MEQENWWSIPATRTMAAFSGYIQSNIETKFFNIVGGNSSTKSDAFAEESQRQIERQIPGAGVVFNILALIEGAEKTYNGFEIKFLDNIAFGLLGHSLKLGPSTSIGYLENLMNATYRFIENTPYFNASMGTTIFNGETLHRIDYNLSQEKNPQKKIDQYYTRAYRYYISIGHQVDVAKGEAEYIRSFLQKYPERREEMFYLFEEYIDNNV